MGKFDELVLLLKDRPAADLLVTKNPHLNLAKVGVGYSIREWVEQMLLIGQFTFQASFVESLLKDCEGVDEVWRIIMYPNLPITYSTFGFSLDEAAKHMIDFYSLFEKERNNG